MRRAVLAAEIDPLPFPQHIGEVSVVCALSNERRPDSPLPQRGRPRRRSVIDDPGSRGPGRRLPTSDKPPECPMPGIQ